MILQISEDVTTHDVEVLGVGVPKVATESIPIILDFTFANHPDGSAEAIEALVKVLGEKFEVYVASPDLKFTKSKSIKAALVKSKNRNVEIILKLLRLNEELIVLQKENEKLLEAAGGDLGENRTHSEMVRENRSLEYVTNALRAEVGHDTKLYEKVKEASQPDQSAIEALAATKLEAIEFMREKGIPIDG